MTKARDLANFDDPWIAYTPTLGGVTVGSGTNSFFYSQIGKTVFVKGKFTLGSGSAITGSVTVSLPITARTNIANFQQLGSCSSFNNSILVDGQSYFINNNIGLQATLATGTYASGTPVTVGAPFTWVSGFSFTVECTYEAA